MNINGERTIVKNNFAGYDVVIGKGVCGTVIAVCGQVRDAVSEKLVFSANDCINCKPNCSILD